MPTGVTTGGNGGVETIWTMPALALLIGYLLGSIPFGLVLTRLAGEGDLRAVGSGNIGATNVLRTGRKGLAAATLLLDAAKGVVAVVVARELGESYAVLGAVGAFLGHCYPLWLGFRGGKGVATLFGIALALDPWCGLVYAVVWLGVLAVVRYASLAGMLAATALLVTAAVREQFELAALFLGLGLILIWKHRTNVERLLAGTEPRVGAKS